MNLKILWATGFDQSYYDYAFQQVKATWDLLPGDVRFYTDDVIDELVDDPRAVHAPIDPRTCPGILSQNEAKFWKKSRSIITAIKNSDHDYCIWLDADVQVLAEPQVADLLPLKDQLLSVNNKTHAPRIVKTKNNIIDTFIDTGFLAINLRYPRLGEWLDHYEKFWHTDQMAQLRRKYDTYALEIIMAQHNYPWRNLWHGTNTGGKFYCGFEDSDLDRYFFHHWGRKRKDKLYTGT
jgi:hypothetical protein